MDERTGRCRAFESVPNRHTCRAGTGKPATGSTSTARLEIVEKTESLPVSHTSEVNHFEAVADSDSQTMPVAVDQTCAGTECTDFETGATDTTTPSSDHTYHTQGHPQPVEHRLAGSATGATGLNEGH